MTALIGQTLPAPPGLRFDLEETLARWSSLAAEERAALFESLGDADATDLFLGLDARAQAEHLLSVAAPARRLWARLLAPDDAADVIQTLAADERPALLA